MLAYKERTWHYSGSFWFRDSELAVQWVLGIDVGSKKTGVAVGQSLTGLARPLTIIRTTAHELNAKQFAVIIAEWKINCIVIGLPVLAD